MKALAIIFASVFFVSLIGFAVTAAVTGFELGNWADFQIGWFHGNRTPYNINVSYPDAYDIIEINTIHANTTITISPDNITRVKYVNPSPRVEFTSGVDNNVLVIRETMGLRVFSWGWGGSAGELYIEIPENIYEHIYINATSGTIIGALPEARNLKINLTSGNVTLNCTKSEALSSYDLQITSGDLKVTGLSGTGKVKMTSGRMDLDFAEWNGFLDANLTSGNLNVTVPSGSGARINFSRTSGQLYYNFDGDEGTMNKGFVISLGGENKQDFNVHLTSGRAEIKTR